MLDPFAASSDPHIPTPSRDDLLNLVHGENRDQLEAGSLPAKVADTLWTDARRQWDEGHKRNAERLREKQAASTDIQPQPKKTTEAGPEPEARQPTDEELIAFMSAKTRSTWENRSDLTPQERARIWQSNKKLWRRKHKTKSPSTQRQHRDLTKSANETTGQESKADTSQAGTEAANRSQIGITKGSNHAISQVFYLL